MESSHFRSKRVSEQKSGCNIDSHRHELLELFALIIKVSFCNNVKPKNAIAFKGARFQKKNLGEKVPIFFISRKLIKSNVGF